MFCSQHLPPGLRMLEAGERAAGASALGFPHARGLAHYRAPLEEGLRRPVGIARRYCDAQHACPRQHLRARLRTEHEAVVHLMVHLKVVLVFGVQHLADGAASEVHDTLGRA